MTRPTATPYLDHMLAQLSATAIVRRVQTGENGGFLMVEMRPGAAAYALIDAAKELAGLEARSPIL